MRNRKQRTNLEASARRVRGRFQGGRPTAAIGLLAAYGTGVGSGESDGSGGSGNLEVIKMAPCQTVACSSSSRDMFDFVSYFVVFVVGWLFFYSTNSRTMAGRFAAFL